MLQSRAILQCDAFEMVAPLRSIIVWWSKRIFSHVLGLGLITDVIVKVASALASSWLLQNYSKLLKAADQ